MGSALAREPAPKDGMTAQYGFGKNTWQTNINLRQLFQKLKFWNSLIFQLIYQEEL
jgi:hypothetical protein